MLMSIKMGKVEYKRIRFFLIKKDFESKFQQHQIKKLIYTICVLRKRFKMSN